MIFIYTWIFFIFFLSVFLNGYLYKKYDDVISMLGFKIEKILTFGNSFIKGFEK